jgi:PadR family transcriptional regulator PadR
MATQQSLSSIELMVMLSVIRLGDGAYGVPISQEIEQTTGTEVLVGSVYAALTRLEEKGLVRSEVGEATAERGGRAKRYFHATGQGVRAVRETRRALMKLWTGVPQVEGGKA